MVNHRACVDHSSGPLVSKVSRSSLDSVLWVSCVHGVTSAAVLSVCLSPRRVVQ